MLSLLLLIPTTFAQDCDARALSKKLSAASPVAVADAFVSLANCDAKKARRAAPEAFGRMIWGDRSVAALRAAIDLEEEDLVRDWIGQRRSDERSSALSALGTACAANESVALFLTESHDVLGAKFWDERWYRALSECRYPAVHELLSKAVEESSSNRDRFLGVLEVYARNLGVAAVPTITELLKGNEDEELAVYLVKTFSDASQVGSTDGQSKEATDAAVAAIIELAPSFGFRTLKQAQTSLLAMGAEAEADRIVGSHFVDRIWEDGSLHYAVVAVETARCKGGKKTRLGIHTGELTEAGRRFPKEVQNEALAATKKSWTLRLAEKCKVDPEIEVFISDAPFSDPAGIAAWNVEQVGKLADRVAKKRIETAQDHPVVLE